MIGQIVKLVMYSVMFVVTLCFLSFWAGYVVALWHG